MYVQFCIYVCVYTKPVQICVLMCVQVLCIVWRPENKLGCHFSSDAIYLVF